MKALLAVAVLLLAGCTTSPATQTSTTQAPAVGYAGLPAQTEMVVAGDGKLLEAVVYRPDTPQPVGAFINFSPYWGDTAAAKGDHFSQYMIDHYVPLGYAVVLSSVRGTGHSEGCFQVGGDLELKDTRDVIDHFAKAAWSNGRIAAGGKSYDSTTQNGVIAKFPTPALKGIFHVSGITDMYRYNAKDGVVYSNGLTFTPRYALGQGTDEYGLPVGTGGGSSGDDSPASLARLVDDLACPELARHVQSGEGTAASGLKDAYWQERDWVHFLPQSTWNGSVFFVHGLQDWNVKPDNIDPWVDILQQKGIEVKGWLHQQTDNLGHLYPMRSDWNSTMEQWMDHVLNGHDNGWSSQLGFDVEGSDGTWRHDPAWPPQAIWQDVETVSGNSALSDGAAGLTAGRDPVRVAGVPYLTTTVQSAWPDAVARADLFVEKAGQRTWVNAAVKRLALSADNTQPGTPDAGPRALNLTFYPMDLELRPGESLVLTLGRDPTAEPGPADQAGFVIRPDQSASVTYSASVLHLPLASLGGALSPQPAPTPCFAC